MWDSKDVSQWCTSLCGVSHEALLRRRLLHALATPRGPQEEDTAGRRRGRGISRAREADVKEVNSFMASRAGGWHGRHAVGLSLALAVFVLAPSRTYAALVQVPFLPKHATASGRLFLFVLHSITYCQTTLMTLIPCRRLTMSRRKSRVAVAISPCPATASASRHWAGATHQLDGSTLLIFVFLFPIALPQHYCRLLAEALSSWERQSYTECLRCIISLLVDCFRTMVGAGSPE